MKEKKKRYTIFLLACFLLLYILSKPAVACCDPPCGTCEHCVDEICVDDADGTDCGNCKECSGGSCVSTCSNTCCNDVCCSTTKPCCNNSCCSNTCCNDVCCGAGQTCCNGTCCDSGDCCNNNICCDSGEVCCTDSGSYCCPSGETCCEGDCCDPALCKSCVSGTCQIAVLPCPTASAGCLSGGACGAGNYHIEWQQNFEYPKCLTASCSGWWVCIELEAFSDDNCEIQLLVDCIIIKYGCTTGIPG